MKLQEKKNPVDIGQQTWTQIQDVAKGEKQANGKMLFICRNTFKMHKAGKLNWANYFDKGTTTIIKRAMPIIKVYIKYIMTFLSY